MHESTCGFMPSATATPLNSQRDHDPSNRATPNSKDATARPGLRQLPSDPQRRSLVHLAHDESGSCEFGEAVGEHPLAEAGDRPAQVDEVGRAPVRTATIGAVQRFPAVGKRGWYRRRPACTPPRRGSARPSYLKGTAPQHGPEKYGSLGAMWAELAPPLGMRWFC